MGINFFDYLSDVLTKTAALPPGSKPEAYRTFSRTYGLKNSRAQSLLFVCNWYVIAETVTTRRNEQKGWPGSKGAAKAAGRPFRTGLSKRYTSAASKSGP